MTRNPKSSEIILFSQFLIDSFFKPKIIELQILALTKNKIK